MATNETTFSFEGRTLRAANGQSVAGALQQSGVRTLSRSTKYHRPRGYTCGFGVCGDCALNVNGAPGVAACTTPVTAGDRVVREQGLPTTGFDLLRAADLIKRWLSAGFQFRLFARRPRLSALAGRIMAILAGGGRFPTESAVARSAITHVEQMHPDIAVVGGAVSGLTAALAAADAGARVVVIDRNYLGGRSHVRTEQVTVMDGQQALPGALFPSLLLRARAHEHVTLLTGTALGWIDGTLPVVTNSTRWELHPARVVLATGSYEIPHLFINNDRPGVMLADAALRLAEMERVLPGKRAVVVTDNSRGHQVADRLQMAGCTIVAIVDSRTAVAASDSAVNRSLADSNERSDVRLIYDALPIKAHGNSRVRGLSITAGTSREYLRTDVVCVALGRRPAEELALHFAYSAAGSPELSDGQRPEPGTGPIIVGTAAGDTTYDVRDIASAAAEAVSHL